MRIDARLKIDVPQKILFEPTGALSPGASHSSG